MSGTTGRPTVIPGVATSCLLITLAFGSFAFGATEPWSRSVLRWLAFATLLLAWWQPQTGDAGRLSRASRGLLAPGIALLVLALVQVVPLPASVIGVLSPRVAELHERTVPPADTALGSWLAERAAEDGVTVDPGAPSPDLPAIPAEPGSGRALSYARHTTLHAAGNWLTALVLFCAAATLARREVLRYRMIWGIVALGGLLGATGLAQKISWNQMLLWFRDRPPGTRPLGPYVNASHFAGYLEMTALTAIGLALALLSVHGRRLDRTTLRAAVLDGQWTLPRLIAAAVCSVLGVAGILASESRGGALAFAAGFVVLLLVRRSRALVVVLLISVAMTGLAVGLVTWIGDQETELEGVPFVLSSADPSSALRLSAWGASIRIFADHPVVGTGLGTFRWAFPGYQRAGEWKEWGHAHNDYVQLLSETGVPGALLLLWAVIVLARRVVLPIAGRARRDPRWTSIGALAAVFAMMVHTVVDFNLQIPGNAALFAVLLGIVSASADDPLGKPRSGGEG